MYALHVIDLLLKELAVAYGNVESVALSSLAEHTYLLLLWVKLLPET
jgi:hypothetical protein